MLSSLTRKQQYLPRNFKFTVEPQGLAGQGWRLGVPLKSTVAQQLQLCRIVDHPSDSEARSLHLISVFKGSLISDVLNECPA